MSSERTIGGAHVFELHRADTPSADGCDMLPHLFAAGSFAVRAR
jgi:hypothetical protein